jgi:hypothetical protein
MSHIQPRWTLPAVLASVLCASPVAAQLQVNRVDDVRFGNIVAGTAKTALRTDPTAAGRYDIINPSKGRLLIQFILPTQMTGPAGAIMPLSFTGTTAGFSDTQSIANQTGFSPITGTTQRTKDGVASVFLGGTVTSSAAQAAGGYTATITMIVTAL